MLYNRSFPDFLIEFPDQNRVSGIPKPYSSRYLYLVIYSGMPPLRTGLLSFRLVSIPVQLHTATKDQHISFHLLHDKCGSRVQNRYYCPVCNVVVERDDRVRGYEFAKDRTSSLPMPNKVFHFIRIAYFRSLLPLNSNCRTALFLILCLYSLACGKRTAHLKWEDTSDNEEGFRIYRITSKDTKKIAEVGPNVTTYTDKDAFAGACYVVSAFNSAGESSPSNTSCLPD